MSCAREKSREAHTPAGLSSKTELRAPSQLACQETRRMCRMANRCANPTLGPTCPSGGGGAGTSDSARQPLSALSARIARLAWAITRARACQRRRVRGCTARCRGCCQTNGQGEQVARPAAAFSLDGLGEEQMLLEGRFTEVLVDPGGPAGTWSDHLVVRQFDDTAPGAESSN